MVLFTSANLGIFTQLEKMYWVFLLLAVVFLALIAALTVVLLKQKRRGRALKKEISLLQDEKQKLETEKMALQGEVEMIRAITSADTLPPIKEKPVRRGGAPAPLPAPLELGDVIDGKVFEQTAEKNEP